MMTLVLDLTQFTPDILLDIIFAFPFGAAVNHD